jgi:hypothetical protein
VTTNRAAWYNSTIVVYWCYSMLRSQGLSTNLPSLGWLRQVTRSGHSCALLCQTDSLLATVKLSTPTFFMGHSSGSEGDARWLGNMRLSSGPLVETEDWPSSHMSRHRNPSPTRASQKRHVHLEYECSATWQRPIFWSIHRRI